MAKDCYWKHRSSPTRRYLCLDGVNQVCPRCCVEKCPVETPDMFAACAAAGHPTWPNVGGKVPTKLVCLESAWDRGVFQTPSVKGFLEALSPLIRPPLRVAHRFVESARHLSYYTQHPDGLLWTDPAAWDAPLFYLAFHGSPGTVLSALDRIGSRSLCEAFRDYGGYNCLLYFSACGVLAGAKGQKFAQDLLEASQVRAVIGYTTDVDWMTSLVIDLLFLYRFYTNPAPWENLQAIFASVTHDVAPAAEMGYTLIQPTPTV